MAKGRTAASATVSNDHLVTLDKSRQLLGLSKAEIARRLGYSQPTVCNWLNGKERLLKERALEIENVIVDYADQHLTYAPTTHVLVNKLLGRVVEWETENKVGEPT